jgi:hypothetical protein
MQSNIARKQRKKCEEGIKSSNAIEKFVVAR